MIHDVASLDRELRSRGLVPSSSELVPSSHNLPAEATPVQSVARPWYLSALLGISGWLAGLFLLAVVGLLFRPDTPLAEVSCGVVLLLAAYAFFRIDRDGAFLAQLALAFSVAGQCLILFALTEHEHRIAAVAGVALAIQSVLVAVMPNALHRALSTFFATIAWAACVRYGLFGGPMLFDRAHLDPPSIPQSIAAWAITWLPIGALLYVSIRREPQWMARGWQPVLRPLLAGLTVGVAFATLVSEPFEAIRWLGDETSIPDGRALWPILSTLGALGGMAVAFALRQRALVALCAFAALMHVSNFYYVLGLGLLSKALLLIGMGALLLLTARSIGRGAST